MITEPPPFDALAAAYDEEFSNTCLGRFYRECTWRKMAEYWPSPSNLLELNAGTGEDALYLAQMGHKVLATDISGKMLSVLGDKLTRAGIQDNVRVKRLAIEDIHLLKGEKFQGVLSNFGGLNCIENVPKFVKDVSPLMTKGGILIVCIMGPWTPWEWLWFLLKGSPDKAFRRLQSGIEWHGIRIYYPHLIKALNFFRAGGFECIDQAAMGILMPPPYANGLVERFPWFFKQLARIETCMSGAPYMGLLADHYLLVLKKTIEDDDTVL